jgi:uncharacterized protein
MRGWFIRRLCLSLWACLGIGWFAAPVIAHAQTNPDGLAMPSFSCAHAPGVDEKLICTDPLLRQADRELGQTYLALRDSNASAVYRTSLRADERSWILQRNTECGMTRYTVVTDGNRPGYVDCFLDEYAERIADLATMRRHPQTSPNLISHPIRSAFPAGPSNASQPASANFTSLQLPPNATNPLLAWRADGTLVLFTGAADGTGTLAGLQAGRLRRIAQFQGTARFSQICSLPDGGLALLPADGGNAAFIAKDGNVARQTLAAPNAAFCGVAGRELTLSDGAGATLDYGPAQLGVTPSPRFVTLIRRTGVATVSPPIRIDSRFHLAATYLPFAESFVVSQLVSQASLEGAATRRWAKSNCLNYWMVHADTAAAQPACIPFGRYADDVPVVLPGRDGTYLAASGAGLYQITGGAAQLVMQGMVSQPVFSPDGCALAFILQQGQPSAGALIVLNACPTSAMPGTPSAHSPAPPKP